MRIKITMTKIIELNPNNYSPLSTPEEILEIERNNIEESNIDEYMGEEFEVKLEMVD